MGEWQGVDTAGRKIAGLLRYTPPAGFYSRMQRAVEAMPEVIQTREIPGLLRKYPEGVPKWEISTVDVPSIVGDRKTIGRQELLDAIQQRSPVFTHGEVLLRDDDVFGSSGRDRLGGATKSLGPTHYPDYALGDEGGRSDYTELLLFQPGAKGGKEFFSHYEDFPEAVAHMRFARHGDEMVLHEIQSDLANENIRRKANASKGEYDWRNDGPQDEQPQVGFPLADAYNDILIKRLALEAARSGISDVRFPDPFAVSDSVGMSKESAAHRYGAMLPRIFEKFAAKTGGADRLPDATNAPGYAYKLDREAARNRRIDAGWEIFWRLQDIAPSLSEGDAHGIAESIRLAASALDEVSKREVSGLDSLLRGVRAPWYPKISEDDAARLATEMPGLMRLGETRNLHDDAFHRLNLLSRGTGAGSRNVRGAGFRMSPEMMQNLLERGVPASVLGAAALQRGDE